MTTKESAGNDQPPVSVIPFCFAFTEDKGKQALIRFRDNLRKFYPECDYPVGLKVRDQPVIQLFNYEADGSGGYCRLWSDGHHGPVFSSPKQLYETYNCSSQGYPVDTFVFSDVRDDDNGMEMTKFLATLEIRQKSELPGEFVTWADQQISTNPLLAHYTEAVKQKRLAKSSASSGKSSTAKAPTAATKKRSVPKPSPAKQQSAKKKAKADAPKPPPVAAQPPAPPTPPVSGQAPSGPSSLVPALDPIYHGPPVAGVSPGCRLIPHAVTSIKISHGELEDSVAEMSYGSAPVRLGDLPVLSVERSTICWHLFSHLVNNLQAPLTIRPGSEPESFIKDALATLNKPARDPAATALFDN